MKTVTVYDVRVLMDNGSVRNLDISTAPAVGSKVIVEGNNLRMATAKGQGYRGALKASATGRLVRCITPPPELSAARPSAQIFGV